MLFQITKMCRDFFLPGILPSDGHFFPRSFPAQAILLILTLFMSNQPVLAQQDLVSGSVSEEKANDPYAQAMVADEIQQRLDKVRKKINTSEDEAVNSQRVRIMELLKMQLERLESLKDDFSLEPLEYPSGMPPFTLSYLDQIRHKYRHYNDEYLLLEEAHEAAQTRIKVAEKALESVKQTINSLKEKGGTADQKMLAQLEYQLEKENYIYARLDARLINQKLTQAKNNLERFGESIPVIEKDIVFSDQDYNIQLQNISEREKMLKVALKQTRDDLSSERNKPEDERLHVEALESLLPLLNEALSSLQFENQIWEERRELYHGKVSAKQAVVWHEENTLKKSGISELVRVRELGQQEHMKVLLDVEKKDSVITMPVNVELQKEILIRRQLAFDNLQTVLELLNDHLADLERIRDRQQLKFMQAKFLHVVNTIWELQLAVIQDRTITVGKSITAIVLFIAGLIIAKLIILRFLYFVFRKVRIREGVAYTITQLLFYLSLLGLLLAVISYAGIPFHIFAFFGGALAIAAGFGSQKIVSNFLSGVILLLEGSIRVGDMVQVDDSKGRIKSIGLRHTQLTTFDNVDILIPNAKFLEENVINWTLESDIIRSNIPVGVDFSAPVDQVIDILVQVALDYPDIQDEPIPEAFLEKINCDNGYLRFNLYYWHPMQSPRERLVINSALQIEIIKRLRAIGVELASPTQDLIMHRGKSSLTASAGTQE